jgi:hypothetical protein
MKQPSVESTGFLPHVCADDDYIISFYAILRRVVFVIGILIAFSSSAEPRYRIVSSGQLGALEDKGGSLMASITPTELSLGTKIITGLRVDKIETESLLVLTQIKTGDSIFAINGLAFYASSDFYAYIRSLDLPGELNISYIDAGNGDAVVDYAISNIVLSENDWAKKKSLSGEIASNMRAFYECSHLTNDDFQRFMRIVENMLPDQPGVMSVGNRISEQMFIKLAGELNSKALDSAKRNICVKRSATSDEIRLAQSQAELFAKCSLIASYNVVVVARIRDSDSIGLWKKENKRMAIELGAKAINALRAVGRDGVAWWDRVSSPPFIGDGNELIPNIQALRQEEKNCIDKGLLRKYE